MTESPATDTSLRAGRREWTGLAVLALPTLLCALDIGVLFLALPRLSEDFRISSAQQLWVADVYGFLTAGFLLTMGTLGDRIGRRRLLLLGGASFGAVSVLAAYSPNAWMLIVSRGLLGIAGATLMPSTLALITNMFQDTRQRGTAIAAWVGCLMTGSALGPVVGGLLLQRFWWGSVFLLSLPVMVLLLILGPVLLPECRSDRAGRLEPVSVLLSLAAVLPIVYGLKELALSGLHAVALPTMSTVVGAVFLMLFVRRQLRLPNPLLDLRLFRTARFTLVVLSMTLAAAAMAGAFLLVSQHLQAGLGYSPAKAGLLLLPVGVSIAVGAQLAPLLAHRSGLGTVISAGLALAAVGFGCIALVQTVAGPALSLLGMCLVDLGAGPLFALGTHLVVGSVPPERAGSAASISETGNTFGSALGLAVLGTVSAAIYGHQMARADLNGVPAAAAQLARSTMAGADTVAAQLPAPHAAQLLGAARHAFTSGMTVVAILGMVIFLGLAVVLRRAAR